MKRTLVLIIAILFICAPSFASVSVNAKAIDGNPKISSTRAFRDQKRQAKLERLFTKLAPDPQKSTEELKKKSKKMLWNWINVLLVLPIFFGIGFLLYDDSESAIGYLLLLLSFFLVLLFFVLFILWLDSVIRLARRKKQSKKE